MGEDSKEFKLYFREEIPLYKKIWYFITFRKNKIPKYKELNSFTDTSIKTHISIEEDNINE